MLWSFALYFHSDLTSCLTYLIKPVDAVLKQIDDNFLHFGWINAHQSLCAWKSCLYFESVNVSREDGESIADDFLQVKLRGTSPPPSAERFHATERNCKNITLFADRRESPGQSWHEFTIVSFGLLNI